jgi:hypothetical protein
VKFDFATSTLLRGVNNATVERARVDMQADGPAIEFPRIVDTVHRIVRIDGTGVRGIHLDGVGGFKVALAPIEVL